MSLMNIKQLMEPGDYVAAIGQPDKVEELVPFTFPKEMEFCGDVENYKELGVSAAWFFLNRLRTTAYVNFVIPISALQSHFVVKTIDEEGICKFGHRLYCTRQDSCACLDCDKEFGWWCEKAPNFYCEYAHADNAQDCCLYCNLPKERK